MTKTVTPNNIIGKDTDFNGRLKCSGDMQIDGHFGGEVSVSGTLFVGESALIEATVGAGHIIAEGKMRGKIRAKKIKICAHGKVLGDILTHSLETNDGAIFEGNVRMSFVKHQREMNLEYTT
jgi:cytoskeletal protein CcmA (bactofilin family)